MSIVLSSLKGSIMLSGTGMLAFILQALQSTCIMESLMLSHTR